MPKVPVSLQAVFARINRKFQSLNDKIPRELRKTRGHAAKEALGDFYVYDEAHRRGPALRVDVEKLARELGVLEDWECLEKEEKMKDKEGENK